MLEEGGVEEGGPVDGAVLVEVRGETVEVDEEGEEAGGGEGRQGDATREGGVGGEEVEEGGVGGGAGGLIEDVAEEGPEGGFEEGGWGKRGGGGGGGGETRWGGCAGAQAVAQGVVGGIGGAGGEGGGEGGGCAEWAVCAGVELAVVERAVRGDVHVEVVDRGQADVARVRSCVRWPGRGCSRLPAHSPLGRGGAGAGHAGPPTA